MQYPMSIVPFFFSFYTIILIINTVVEPVVNKKTASTTISSARYFVSCIFFVRMVQTLYPSRRRPSSSIVEKVDRVYSMTLLFFLEMASDQSK